MIILDARNKNPGGLVDTDAFVELIIGQYRAMASNTKNTLEDLFISADVLR